MDDPRLWRGTLDLSAWNTWDETFYEPRALLLATYRPRESAEVEELTQEALKNPLLKAMFDKLLDDMADATKPGKRAAGESQTCRALSLVHSSSLKLVQALIT